MQNKLFSLSISFLTINALFSQFPFLNKTGEDIDQIFQDWKKYKCCVPVYGAVILNETCTKVIKVVCL